MIRQYKKSGDKRLLHLFHEYLMWVLERRNYVQEIRMENPGAPVIYEYLHKEDGSIIAVSVAEVTLDTVEITMESETVDLTDILMHAITDLASSIATTFVEPKAYPELAAKLEEGILSRIRKDLKVGESKDRSPQGKPESQRK